MRVTDTEDYDGFIRPGVDVLDEDRPDWASLVDLDNFDMLSTSHCVLGHVYGNWGRGLDHLVQAGYLVDARYFADFTGGPVERAWRREVERRQAATV